MLLYSPEAAAPNCLLWLLLNHREVQQPNIDAVLAKSNAIVRDGSLSADAQQLDSTLRVKPIEVPDWHHLDLMVKESFLSQLTQCTDRTGVPHEAKVELLVAALHLH